MSGIGSHRACPSVVGAGGYRLDVVEKAVHQYQLRQITGITIR
jgi:hypothetical protein